MSQRDVIFQCRIVAAELRGTNSDLKIGGGLRRNRGGVQRGGVRPPVGGRVGPSGGPFFFPHTPHHKNSPCLKSLSRSPPILATTSTICAASSQAHRRLVSPFSPSFLRRCSCRGPSWGRDIFVLPSPPGTVNGAMS